MEMGMNKPIPVPFTPAGAFICEKCNTRCYFDQEIVPVSSLPPEIVADSDQFIAKIRESIGEDVVEAACGKIVSSPDAVQCPECNTIYAPYPIDEEPIECEE